MFRNRFVSVFQIFKHVLIKSIFLKQKVVDLEKNLDLFNLK